MFFPQRNNIGLGRGGFYRFACPVRWLRRQVPAGDALMMGFILLLIYMEPGLQEPEATPGLAALGAEPVCF